MPKDQSSAMFLAGLALMTSGGVMQFLTRLPDGLDPAFRPVGYVGIGLGAIAAAIALLSCDELG